MAICGHRNFDAFAILHAEFPKNILEVFLLRYEYAIVLLTNLNVLCLRVLNWVVSNLDGTLIVA